MLRLEWGKRFEKQRELAKKRGKDINKLNAVANMLLKQTPLLPKHKNHKLKGEYAGAWECHIEPDWLLVYEKHPGVIFLLGTGSHSDIF